MLTTTHIVTLLTVGVLLSAGIALIVEWVAKRTLLGLEYPTAVKKWGPLVLGMPLGAIGFPLAYGAVVGPVDTSSTLAVVAWLILGAFAGTCAGTGAWLSHDLARSILSKVGR